jgi:ABC-2 type transport system permease protein
MRLLSEEQRQGTLELLLTTPVRDWEVVVGKWLGSFLFILTVVAITLIYPFILNRMIDPGIDQGQMITGYLGVILIAAAFLGIGVAISSLFSNQVASYLTTFGVLVFLWWLLGIFTQVSGPLGSSILNHLDFSRQFYEVLNQGVIELSGVVYLISVTAFTLFLGAMSVEMRRWR